MKNLDVYKMIEKANIVRQSSYYSKLNMDNIELDSIMQELVHRIAKYVNIYEFNKIITTVYGYTRETNLRETYCFASTSDLVRTLTNNFEAVLLNGQRLTGNEAVSKDLYLFVLKRPNFYRYSLCYLLDGLGLYGNSFGLSDEEIIYYSKALVLKALTLRDFRTPNDGDIYSFIPDFFESMLRDLGNMNPENGFKFKLYNELFYNSIKDDFKLFKSFGSRIKSIPARYIFPDDLATEENITEVLNTIQYGFNKYKARVCLIDFTAKILITLKDNDKKDKVIDFIFKNVSEKELKSLLKRYSILSSFDRIMEFFNGLKRSEELEMKRGSVDYYSHLSTSYQAISSRKDKITALDEMQFINRQNLSELQLYFIEKILDVTMYSSETIMKKQGYYGKLISTCPRVYNNLASLINTLSDKQYEESRMFIDMIINRYLASKSFFTEVPSCMITVCNDTRLAEDLLFMIEHKRLNTVRESFIDTYAKGKYAEAVSWAFREFMKLEDIMILDKEKYPKLCKMYIKYAI